MSVRLLTTLVLLLQSAGQKPDHPIGPMVDHTPLTEVVITTDGPMTLDAFRATAALPKQDSVWFCTGYLPDHYPGPMRDSAPGVRDNFYPAEEIEPDQSLLFQNIELNDDGIATLLPAPAEGWVVAQHEPRYQDDVFPLHRLAEDWEPEWRIDCETPVSPRREHCEVVQSNYVYDLVCNQLGLMVLHQVCPPLSLCSACQIEPVTSECGRQGYRLSTQSHPCDELMTLAFRRFSNFFSNCYVQAQCPANHGCPYYHPPVSYPPTYYCPEQGEVEEAIEDCSGAMPEELTVMPQEVESAEDACSCCNKKCVCKSKCGCDPKSDQCSCCNEKCGCGKDKSSKVKKAGACCCTSVKVKAESKCRCSNCSKDGDCCCSDECACAEGACSCAKAVKVKVKADGKCRCSDCSKDDKCCCDEACACAEGACSCAKAVKLKVKADGKCRCSDCSKDDKCCCDEACACAEGACSCAKAVKLKVKFAADRKCGCKDCGKDGKCNCGADCGCKEGACKCGQSATKYECPHLKAQEAKRLVKHEPVRQFTALENLERISQARVLFQKAEQLRKAGRHELADLCYHKAVKAAPGSRYEVLARAAIAEIDEHKAVAKLSPLEKAKHALKKGDVLKAYQFAEEAYGEAYSVMSQAQALLRVIDTERFQTSTAGEESEESPCHPGKVCDYVPTEVKVAEYLEAGHRALTAGCISEALRLADLALELDADCPAARYLHDRAEKMVQFEEEQQETNHCLPESNEDPCEADPEARLCPSIPPIDCTISAVLQKVLQEYAEEPSAEERDWQLIDLYVDPEECDGYAPTYPPYPPSEAEDEPHGACVGALIGQLIQAASGGHCVEIDTASSQGPRVWIQLGAANCRWSVQGGGAVQLAPGSYYDGCDEAEPPCSREVTTENAPNIKVQIAGPCEISIHIKWNGTATECQTTGCSKVLDQRDIQAAHEQEVLHWIESMNSGVTGEEPGTDHEEDDVNVDPCD